MKISSLLKQLFVALALVGGVGATTVQASTTTYNFAFTTSIGLTGSGSLINNSVGNTWSFGSDSALVTDGTYSSAVFSANQTYAMTTPTSVIVTAGSSSFGFLTSASTRDSVYFYGPNSFSDSAVLNAQYKSGLTTNTVTTDLVTYSAPTAPGAPEIDGSLAPKVGFLLGCLFLMFGRKKQNTEPMMMA